MKPRKLKIMGLNSFNEEQEIDFSILTEKGFFGIFGPTGSGKSTILDAITIALYGEISRSTKNRLEFINSYRNDMNIYYEFELGSQSNRKIYSSERHYKRKKDGGIACDRAILSDITTEEKEILSEGSNSVTDSITALIGLKCDDFTRSVVLPQGRFSDFLKLTKGDRGKMLERILNLEEFGSKIAFKVKGEITNKKSQLDVIYGAMSRYKELNVEGYEELKQRLTEAGLQLLKLKEEKQELATAYDKFNVVWQEQQELKIFDERQQKLLGKTEEFEKKRNVLRKGRAAIIVKPYIDNYDEVNNRLRDSKLRLEKISLKHEETSVQLEKTKLDYTKAYDIKEKELPLLIEKEARLNEAVRLETEILKLEVEIKSLKQEYRNIKAEATSISDQITNNQQEKEKLLIDIDGLVEKINNSSISTEYREKIQSAVEIEKEYNEKSSTLSRLKLKVQELGAYIVKNKTFHQDLMAKKEKLESQELLLKQNRNNMDRNAPGTNEDIVNITSEVMQKSNAYNNAKLNRENSDALKEQIVKLEQKKSEIEKFLTELLKQLHEAEAKLKTSGEELTRLEKLDMAGHLARTIIEGEECPVCGSMHHPKLATVLVNEHHSRLKNEIDNIKKRIESYKLKEGSYNIELAGIASELNIKAQALSESEEKLMGCTVVEYEKAKLDAQEQLLTLKNSIEKYEIEVRKNEEQTKEIVSEINLLNLDLIKLSTTLKKDEEMFEIQTMETNQLRDSVNVIQSSYFELKEELGAIDIKQEYDRLNKSLREVETSRKIEQQLRGRVSELDMQRNILEGKKTAINSTLEQVAVSGREKTNEMNRLIVKRDEYSENRIPKEYLYEVRKLSEDIKANENICKQYYEKENTLLIKLSEEKVSETNSYVSLKDALVESNNKLMQILSENEFENNEASKAALIEKEVLSVIDNEIKSYENELRNVQDNVSRLNKKLSVKVIDEESWNKLLIDRVQNETELEEMTKAKASYQRDIEGMEKDFDELKLLTKQKKEQEKEMALLNDIMELISGNKFVEFAATNQLKYISMEASKRLGAITRGRYALELDSSNEFVMRDDFNGGIRRSSDTLSGGETFLTSLCLALSLSSNIQLKGSTPLEFFFLDEGFGTLDTELLEVVISSLERLRNDKLCVGIISHVEELKSRVPVKLLLKPATIEGNGSKLSIEYS